MAVPMTTCTIQPPWFSLFLAVNQRINCPFLVTNRTIKPSVMVSNSGSVCTSTASHNPKFQAIIQKILNIISAVNGLFLRVVNSDECESLTWSVSALLKLSDRLSSFCFIFQGFPNFLLKKFYIIQNRFWFFSVCASDTFSGEPLNGTVRTFGNNTDIWQHSFLDV